MNWPRGQGSTAEAQQEHDYIRTSDDDLMDTMSFGELLSTNVSEKRNNWKTQTS